MPPGRELAARNRRLMAERGRWPAGALEECERLDAAHPDWSTCWLPENRLTGFERPACFAAQPWEDRLRWRGAPRWLHAPTAAELEALIVADDARAAAYREEQERRRDAWDALFRRDHP